MFYDNTVAWAILVIAFVGVLAVRNTVRAQTRHRAKLIAEWAAKDAAYDERRRISTINDEVILLEIQRTSLVATIDCITLEIGRAFRRRNLDPGSHQAEMSRLDNCITSKRDKLAAVESRLSELTKDGPADEQPIELTVA